MGNLGLYLSTVIGFLSVLILGMVMFIHYLRVGLDSKSSVVVDPKPENNFNNQ